MNIVPAIDIIDSKIVRLAQGDYSKVKKYELTPLEMAILFQEKGFKYLHLVDLDGALERKPVNLKILAKIASKTKLKIDYSGGVSSVENAKRVFDNGANQICIGTLSVYDKKETLDIGKKLGVNKIVLASDVKNGTIRTHGWKKNSNVRINKFISEYKKEGYNFFMTTDIENDGMLKGINKKIYTDILSENSDINLIAGGGISSLENIRALKKIGIKRAILGKAIYENKIFLTKLSNLTNEL